MKKRKNPRVSAVIVVGLCVLAGCSGLARNEVEKPSVEVKVYEPEQLKQDQYALVRYLWVDSWRTAFSLPTYSSEAKGIASLQAEAARLGANGLINVSCRDQGHFIWTRSREPAILCYGNAIRVR